jgi:L-threonylcarbamoyladenylate synthase
MVLARAFWPGPLTLIVPAAAWVPEAVHAGTGTVGVRVSPHPVATALARELGAPLTATSANRSGDPPARHPDEVRRAFPEIVVVDGGETRGGPPSTVVDLCVQPARLLRPGAVPWEEIARVLGAGRS